jgi:transcriptional regulator of acetoin/glycerol metabolism
MMIGAGGVALQFIFPHRSELGHLIQELQFAWVQMAEQRRIGSSVRPIVAESWLRCLEMGVPLDRKVAPLRWQGNTMEQNLKNNARLLEIALPVMEQLYQYIAGSGFLIALTDSKGTLLEVQGEPDVFERGARNNFIVGADWSEEGAGTNGIGTCLRIQTPVQIFSAEHYCPGWQDWTCSGAPIRDPISGKILGVLDVSGGQELVHAHNLGIVAAAANIIEQRLKEYQFQLAQYIYRLVIDTTSDGMIVIEPNGTINSINASALQILSLTNIEEASQWISQWPQLQEIWVKSLNGDPLIEEKMVLLPLRKSCLVSSIPIQYGKIFVGTLMVLREIPYSSKVNPKTITVDAVYSEKHMDEKKGFGRIVTKSRKMEWALRTAKIAATHHANVLLLGESGTGKELFARAIHEESAQRGGPFIPVNCGAIPRELIASELFGYVEGSFTGALKKGKKGKFELAAGGTLFLDEIGEMPLEMQVVLLRALEEKVIYPVGAEEGIAVSCRIIAATNQNLTEQVEARNFRADLYYRLNVLSLSIPPLRERTEDILMLASYFLKQWNRSLNDLDPEVKKVLLEYPWPGNVRELKNTLERMVYLSDGEIISRQFLPSEMETYCIPGGNHFSFTSSTAEKEILLEVLRENQFNYSLAAKSLGISRATLYRRLRKLNIR